MDLFAPRRPFVSSTGDVWEGHKSLSEVHLWRSWLPRPLFNSWYNAISMYSCTAPNVIHCTYRLDTAHYFTFSHVSSEAILKVRQARAYLLQDRTHLMLAEKMLRGGVILAFSDGIVTKNKKYREGFDDNKAIIYALFVNFNILHAEIMEKLPLQLGDFQIVQVDLSRSLKFRNNFVFIYVLTEGLEYPDDHHIVRKDISSASTEKQWLGHSAQKSSGLVQMKDAKACTRLAHEKEKHSSLYHARNLSGCRTHSKKVTSTLRAETRKRVRHESVWAGESQRSRGKNLESQSTSWWPFFGIKGRWRVEETVKTSKLLMRREAVLENCDRSQMKSVNNSNGHTVASTCRRRSNYWDAPKSLPACICDSVKHHLIQILDMVSLVSWKHKTNP